MLPPPHSSTNLCPHLCLAAIRAYAYNEPVNPPGLGRVGVGVAGMRHPRFRDGLGNRGAFAEGGPTGVRRDKPVGSLTADRYLADRFLAGDFNVTDVAILGATGYSALELIKLLLRHPEVRITTLTSRQEGGPRISEIHPSLTGRIDLRCEQMDLDRVSDRAQCVFCALPQTASMEVVPILVERGLKVIDFSADYRLRDPAVYEHWYGAAHTDVDHLGEAVYGLPEWFADRIPAARLVANPGCYPTSAILALAPLLRLGLIEPSGIVIDAKSGVSGSGRTPKLMSHFPECNESLSAYNIGRHRHTPEIDQILSEVAGADVQVVFTPHLIPMDRGILTTIYARPVGSAEEDNLLEQIAGSYRDKPFVRVVEHLPATKDSVGTNFCDVTLRVVRGYVVMVSCLDNLCKGAAGQAVQNFNLMYGHDEKTGLL